MGGGVILLILLVGGAMMFGGGGSGGGSEDCGRVTLSADMVVRNMDRVQALVASAKPTDGAFDLISRLMKILAPSCSWSRTTTATIVGPNGEYDWQNMVAVIGDKTVLEANSDPALMSIFQSGEGISPSTTAAQAAARAFGVNL